jgi:hypothetical protein
VVGSSAFAAAQDRVVVDCPAVVVSAPVPEVKAERRDRPVIERREVEITERGGCDSKTVRREYPEGSATVKKKRCN